jgi:hypothetical protein
MTRCVYHIDVDRVVVTGAGAEGLGASELRALIELAVAGGLARAPLPAGRTMRTAVQVSAPPIAGGAQAVARAVAAGVAQAVGGGASRG